MDELYKEEILDHYKNPRNYGEITHSEAGEFHHAHAANQGCGDSIEADLVIKGGIVAELKWRGTGCAISLASMSLVSEWAIGKSWEDVGQLSKDKILSLVGIPEIAPAREKCLLISLQIFSPHSAI